MKLALTLILAVVAAGMLLYLIALTNDPPQKASIASVACAGIRRVDAAGATCVGYARVRFRPVAGEVGR